MRDRFGPDRDQQCSRSKLWDSEIRGMEKPPRRHIPLAHQCMVEFGPILREPVVHQTADVLEHHRQRPTLADQPERLGEEVTLIVSAQLFAGLRERWTRDSTRQEMDLAAVTGRVPFAEIVLDGVPVRTIHPQRGACMRIEFDEGRVAKACPL